MKKGKLKKIASAVIGSMLFLGGTTPTVSAVNDDKSQTQNETRHSDENKLHRTVTQHRKRTSIGTIIGQKGKHQFAMIPQKHKKHTNRNHKRHAAKVKRRKARK